jgi:hypothetical protein
MAQARSIGCIKNGGPILGLGANIKFQKKKTIFFINIIFFNELDLLDYVEI